MPQNARIWRVSDTGTLNEVESTSLDAEEQLEDWLAEDISILSEKLLVIGRQVETDFGGALDLLCLDPEGDLVIVELKRDKTPRQDQNEELYFQVYTYRLAAVLETDEETVRTLLPENRDEWSYGTGWNERWSGVDGGFRTSNEVTVFVEKLKELATE